MLCRCAEMQRRECKAEKWWLSQTVDPRTGGLRTLPPDTTSCFTEVSDFFYQKNYQKPTKFKQTLPIFPVIWFIYLYCFEIRCLAFSLNIPQLGNMNYIWSFRICYPALIFAHNVNVCTCVNIKSNKNNCTWKYCF